MEVAFCNAKKQGGKLKHSYNNLMIPSDDEVSLWSLSGTSAA